MLEESSSTDSATQTTTDNSPTDTSSTDSRSSSPTDADSTDTGTTEPGATPAGGTRRRRAAKRPAGPPPAASPEAAEVPSSGADALPEVAAAAAPTDATAAAPARRAAKRAPRKRVAAPPANETPAAPDAAPGAPAAVDPDPVPGAEVVGETPTRRTTKRAPRKKAAAVTSLPAEGADPGVDLSADPGAATTSEPEPVATSESPPETSGALFSAEPPPAPVRRRRVTKKAAAPTPASADVEPSSPAAVASETGTTASSIASEPESPQTADGDESATAEAPATGIAPLFQAPDPTAAPVRRRARKAASRPTSQPRVTEDDAAALAAAPHSDVVPADEAESTDGLATGAAGDGVEPQAVVDTIGETDDTADSGSADSPDTPEDSTEDPSEDTGDDDADAPSRRRRRRGGRRRRRSGSGGSEAAGTITPAETIIEEPAEVAEAAEELAGIEEPGESGTTRRRRRRRRRGEGVDVSPDDPANTVVRVREPRTSDDEITAITGSTRLEAKKQRRREGRDAGRRRAPIVSESEFLARRESVKREMIVRQKDGVSQIAVLEDGVLVEHYVARESQTSLIGNVYLGRVQNVLPSMEAAFVDIGKGRNAVLYAGEVDWKALGVEGRPRKVEEVLKPGQTILVQVTKDPVGHKGARLTGQISLPGRYVVYVPGGQSSGISRKLSDTERSRLKSLLKDILPDEAGVIIRTAAEGATEEQLTRDVGALTARWEDITKKAASSGSAAQLLYGEPDLMIKVVRDLFNEDFVSLAVQGDDAWDMINGYVSHVAPDLNERLSRWGDGTGDHRDVFAAARIDEQIAKGLDRKVWLPSGGSLIIDRTEAMTVVDVNTGKFTGSGGNLEETVTKNNLEAAEEIVRQLRLRDIGGIIVIDFIDMVLENNRDLVLRRMVECLGRDRTRHQVAEVTSLGLVQMTRKKIGTGLLEAFSETCDRCHGRGLVLHAEPIEPEDAPAPSNESRSRGGNGASQSGDAGSDGGRRGRRGGRSGRGDNDDSLVKVVEVRPAESRYLGPRPVLEPKPPVAEPLADHADHADHAEAEPDAPLAVSATDGVGSAAPLVTDSAVDSTPDAVLEPAAEPDSPATTSVEAPVATVVADVPAVAAKRPRRRASRPAAPPAPVPAAEPDAVTAAEPTFENAAEPAAVTAPADSR